MFGISKSIGYAKPYAKPTHLNLLSSYIHIIKTYGPNILPIEKLILIRVAPKQ